MSIQRSKFSAIAIIATFGLILSSASADIVKIRISPGPGSGALNQGSNAYTQDHAVGIAAANETAQPASAATGDEIGAGITFDDVTKLLSFDFAYGSAFGFTDLSANFSAIHLHGPGPVNFPAANTSAAVLINLAAFHLASGTTSGRVTGSVGLTAPQESMLYDNNIYINIHSATFGAGEIRGQLVPVPEPSAFALLGLVVGFVGVRKAVRLRDCG